jgi:ubiquinone biosynthesis monooxygenase Coq7
MQETLNKVPTSANRQQQPFASPSVASMLRVSHAGEVGAVQIYRGQQAVLRRKNPEKIALLAHMEQQERHHRDTLHHHLLEQQARPSALMPLWNIAGFALGALTATMGTRAAMACTIAVEEVIDNHYAQQVAALQQTHPQLAETLEIFRQEEVEHATTAASEGGTGTPGYTLLKTIIQTGSRAAIAIASRW